MNTYVKYGIEFIVFMAIFCFVDTRNGQSIHWILNLIFSIVILMAQIMIDKRKSRFQK